MVNVMEVAPDSQSGVAPTANLGTILIVEDDPRMQRTLERTFAQEHYSTVIAGDGQSGLDMFRSEHPLAVVLDLILPNISGRELCRLFKQISSETPIIVLSAISEVADKVLLLELGADDYVTKPFSPTRIDGPGSSSHSPPAQARCTEYLSVWRLRSGLQEDDGAARGASGCAHGP